MNRRTEDRVNTYLSFNLFRSGTNLVQNTNNGIEEQQSEISLHLGTIFHRNYTYHNCHNKRTHMNMAGDG